MVASKIFTGIFVTGSARRFAEVGGSARSFSEVGGGASPKALSVEAVGAEHLRVLLVERLSVVVERGRLQDDARSADQHRQREDPEEEPVQHHRHVLPVLLDLEKKIVS